MKGSLQLAVAVGILAADLPARDLVWTGEASGDWNLTDLNWRVKDDPSGEAVAFASGDNAWFVDLDGSAHTVRKIHPNLGLGETPWDVGTFVISNEVDTFTFTVLKQTANGQDDKHWDDTGGTIAGMEKRGAGAVHFTFRFQHAAPVTVSGGTFSADHGSDWPGEWYSALGGLYSEKRHTVAFGPGTVLRFGFSAILGSICSAPGMDLTLAGATVDFDAAGTQNFGDTLFDDATIRFSRVPSRISFSGNTEYRGTRPYVYPCVIPSGKSAGASEPYLTFGQGWNVADVTVADITGDAAPDLVISNRLADAVYNTSFSCNTFRKRGPGTMLLANGYSSTTGDFQVVEGTLALAGYDGTVFSGASSVGSVCPSRARTVAVRGAKTRLRIDSPLAPRNLPRRWTLSVSDGAAVSVGADVPFLQLGALQLADAAIDFSSVAAFGVSGRLILSGLTPMEIPDCADGVLAIGLTPDDETEETPDGEGLVGRRCVLEAGIADATGDAATDLTIGRVICDLPVDRTAANPNRGFRPRGAFLKTGPGTLRLTAANTYSGGTEIASGTLRIDGSIVGDLDVRPGGYVGGAGETGAAVLSDGGGLCVAADATDGAVLKVASFSAAGKVCLLLAGGAGHRFVYSDRPFLRILDKPAALDFSGWVVYSDAGKLPADALTFAYDPVTGLVSFSGEVSIPSIESPVRGMADYYSIDWPVDTPERTAAGTWTAAGIVDYVVGDGMLAVSSDEDASLDFTPHERCEASPYAAFDMPVSFRVAKASQGMGDNAVALDVIRTETGDLRYRCGCGDGWHELFGVDPVADDNGDIEAQVRFEVDESEESARLSFVVDGVRLADASGRTWFPRAGEGRIQGGISLTGVGRIGDVQATRSDPARQFATREADGTWTYCGIDGLARAVADGRRYFLVMPEACAAGSRYFTRLPLSQVPAAGLGVWPPRGMMCTLESSNGVWCVNTERLPGFALDFTVLPGQRTFVSSLSTVDTAQPLSVHGAKNAYGGMLGGELVLLGGMPMTPPAVSIGENARLTVCAPLGDGPVRLGVALGGVFDAREVPGGQTVGALEVDAYAGFGSMTGVRLADAGTLEVTRFSGMRATGQLPCDFSATADAANVTGWQFVLDGKPVTDGPAFTFGDGMLQWRNRTYPEGESAGWTRLPIWGGGYMMNVIYTSDPKILYSHADVCGPFRSDDGGLSWRRLDAGLPLGMRRALMDEVRSLSVDPRDPDSLVAVTGGDGRMLVGGFMVSRNGGRSWRKTGWTAIYGGTQRVLGQVLVRDPNDPDTLVGGEDWYGLFLSRDNGETWTRTCDANAWFSCVHWDRKVRGRVYACAKAVVLGDGYQSPYPEAQREGGVWMSEDAGASWRKISDAEPGEIAQIAGDDRLIGIFGRQHVKISSDGGVTWTDFETGLQISPEPTPSHGDALSYNALACGSDFWLVGEGGGNIYRRGVGDAAWTKLAKPTFAVTDAASELYEAERVRKGDVAMFALCSIDIDPRNERHWFTTDWFTLWETTDAGASFTSRNVGISQLCSIIFEADPLDANCLFYGLHDMFGYNSTDGGATFRNSGIWTAFYGGTGHLALSSVAYSPFEPGVVYAAAYDIWGGYGIARSADHGLKWEYPACAGIPSRQWGVNGVNEVTFRPGHPNEVWACVGGLVGEGNGGPYVSTDGGASWTWKGQGMAEGEPYYTVDTRNGGPIHGLVFSSDGSAVTHSKSSGDFYRWSEADQMWHKTFIPSGSYASWKNHSLEADPFRPGRYLLTCDRQPAESLDGGASWHPFEGYAGNCSQCAFDRNTPGLLVLAAEDGIFVSWDGGKTFSELSGGWDFASGCTTVLGSNYTATTLAQVTVDRRRLFVATGTGGVFRRDLVPPAGLRLLAR